MTWQLDSTEDTEAFGAALAAACASDAGGVIYLDGDLGAGKTTLVRGFMRALGVEGAVRSPTYTLVEPYSASCDVVHLDLYRLMDPMEVETLGLDHWPPEHAWWLVEWPARGEGMLPAPDLVLRLAVSGSGRRLDATGASPLGKRLLHTLDKSP